MKSDMILDNIPCGIVKLKAESGFPVLYANDEFKQLHGAAKRLEDIVEPPDYQELEQDMPSLGTDRHSQTNFPRALGDRNVHDIHDSDATDKQGDTADTSQKNSQHLGCHRQHLAHLFKGTNREIILRSRRDTVCLS